MEKKKLGIGQYTTTSTCYFEGRISPTKANMSLTDEAKAAVLEFLTESLDFHTLVCDIAGNVRKEVEPEKEYKELKEECLHVCDRYKQLQEISNDLLRRWKDETGKRMKAQAALEDSHSHHNNVMNEIKDLLKEVDVPSVKSAIEALKAERVKGKLLAEQYELSTNENDKLEKLLREIEGRYDRIAKGYDNACKEAKTIENIRKSLSANYDRLAEDYNHLSARYNNQKECIAKYIEENERCIRENDKLKASYEKKNEALQALHSTFKRMIDEKI